MKKEVRNSIEDGEDSYSFKVAYVTDHVGVFVIDIYDPIEHVSQFRDAIRALEQADDRNGVRINLQCGGGSGEATEAFVHAMRSCEGHIHVVATGGVHSAATMILLEADSFELSANFNSLIHCGSLGTYGNFNEFKSSAQFKTRYMYNLLHNIYKDFLTEEEIDRVLDGHDYWMDAKEWVERFQKREEARKTERNTLKYNPEDVAFPREEEEIE